MRSDFHLSRRRRRPQQIAKTASPALILTVSLTMLIGCGSTSQSHNILNGADGTTLSASAARNLPECRKARMLCGEANPSPGIREACLRATRDCREARTSHPKNPESPASPDSTTDSAATAPITPPPPTSPNAQETAP